MCVYLVLAAALFWPRMPWDATHIIAGPSGQEYPDPIQTLWFLEWVPFALRHGLDVMRSNYLNFPTGIALANNTSSPLLGILAAPVTVSLGPVVALNVLLRLAFASSAASMFIVLRTWCRWPAAFIGGLFYGFGPYMISQGHTHLDLVFVPIPPLIVWCLYELLVTRPRRPLLVGAVLGGLCGAQALIDPEILALLSVVVGCGLVVIGALNFRTLHERLGDLARAGLSALVAFAVVAGYVVWSMMVAPGHVVGSVQPLATLGAYSADFIGSVIPTSYQLIAPAALTRISDTYVHLNVTENATYLGLPLVLFITFVAYRWRQQRVILASALLALVAFILSLGPYLVINARSTGIAMPERLLEHLPLVSSIVPARFALVVSLFVAIVLGIGADQIFHALRTRTELRRGFAIAGVIGLVISFVVILPRAPITSRALPEAVSVATLDAIPPGSVVLNYPYPVTLWSEAMYWQATEGMRFRIVGGYATVQGPNHTGVLTPPLLTPPLIQEYFTESQNGENFLYPNPRIGADSGPDLCRFVARYDVGAVVFWDRGVHPKRVENFLLATLGTPTKTSHDRSLMVWLTKPAPGTCSRTGSP
jgi:hypothetical protein